MGTEPRQGAPEEEKPKDRDTVKREREFPILGAKPASAVAQTNWLPLTADTFLVMFCCSEHR